MAKFATFSEPYPPYHFQNFHESCLWLKIFFSKSRMTLKTFVTHSAIIGEVHRYFQNFYVVSRTHSTVSRSQSVKTWKVFFKELHSGVSPKYPDWSWVSKLYILPWQFNLIVSYDHIIDIYVKLWPAAMF